MDTEEEKALRESSRNMKTTVQIIQEKMDQQALIYESIEAETERNGKILFLNIRRFEEAIRRMNSDPRNKIIFMLFLVIVGCSGYLFF
ncbi:uncharacterized protein Eint_101105 [Encephalitozoon intestinalis ATCC 50506]|uniref:Uncharacterized protein n=1 Tax=Encephalitozoon intestinalis (strain ATCC 50506) TaxID=876142 RepID=W8PGV0_ENCIT|nr:uncharacterized protein Eint_101105 [Encephalitozoon intestinalis ATCC 50506]AHL30161.1 hypothetical protein Eint_101105 [Encephalitozoon intestinalis ATCC 50506]UTX46271.1 hypothetical protein GPK93_10g18710 [Encephalitozoon intestinalis]